MISIAYPTKDDTAKIASFISSLNKQNENHIGYIGTEKEEIENALLNDFSDIPFHKSFILAYEQDKLIGVVGFDTDLENKQAETWGPFVDHLEWETISMQMWDSILTLIPKEVSTISFFINELNVNSVQFARTIGAVESGVHSILTIRNDQLEEQYLDSEIDILEIQDQAAVSNLHNESFPNSYLSGNRMLENVNDFNKIFVCKRDGEFAGYIYVEANPEFGDASIEFFAVSPSYRGKGIGKALLLHGARWLLSFDSISKIQLCVNAKNEGAIHLYKKIGFEEIFTLSYLEKEL